MKAFIAFGMLAVSTAIAMVGCQGCRIIPDPHPMPDCNVNPHDPVCGKN